MSAKNGGGGVDPPSPLVSQKSEIGLPPLRLLSEKIRNWLTPPLSPLSEIIFCRTPINLVRPTFQEETYNFEINQFCVKHKKEKKEHLRQK